MKYSNRNTLRSVHPQGEAKKIALVQWDSSYSEIQITNFSNVKQADIYDQICNGDGGWTETTTGSERNDTVFTRYATNDDGDLSISVIAEGAQLAREVIHDLINKVESDSE